MIKQKVDWNSKTSILTLVRQLRLDGEVDDAIAICKEGLVRFPSEAYYPRALGDMLFKKAQYLQAAEFYADFFSKMSESKNMFTEFANRFYKIKRNVAKDDLTKLVRNLFHETNSLSKKDLIIKLADDLIHAGNYNDDVVTKEGSDFYGNLMNNASGVLLIKEYKILEMRNPVESEYLLEKYIETVKPANRSYTFDCFVLSLYEKSGKYDKALKLAKELLELKLDTVVIRTFFRICRVYSKYEEIDNFVATHSDVLKNVNFNVLYELVYYYENHDNLEKVIDTLTKMERQFLDNLPIQKTVKNFYLKFGLVDDANRVDITINKILAHKKNVSKQENKYDVVLQETVEGVSSKIKELYSRLEHQTRLAAISDLSRGISHELGQPITNIRYTIQFYSKKLENSAENVIIKKIFKSILEETDRMGGLIDRLAPITSTKRKIETFDLVRRIEDRVQSVVGRTGLNEIEVRVKGSKQILVNWDPIQFDQIMSNLLINSVDSLTGSNASKKIITIIATDKGDTAHIIFEDNGVGVPAKFRGKIFDPFFTTKQPGKGEGLGLFIVWNILKMIGGKIALDQFYNKGAKFTFSFPKDCTN